MSTPAAAWPALVYVIRRLAAFLVDGLLLYAGVLLTQTLLYLFGLHPFRAHITASQWPAGASLHLWVWASVSVPFWLYYAALHSSAWQATLGKRLLGLRVMALPAGRLSFGRALGRAVVMLIPFEANHFVVLQLAPLDGAAPGPAFYLGLAGVYALLALYLGWVVLSPRRQGPHDWAAGSQVR